MNEHRLARFLWITATVTLERVHEGTLMPMTHIPEIGAENRFFSARLTCNLGYYFGTEFFWYRFPVTNRTCSIFVPVYDTGFLVRFSATISGTCAMSITC